jgi:nitrate reductase NapAB chaperone NapD
MQNNLVELMSLLVFVMPEMFANKKEQLKKMFSMFPVSSLEGRQVYILNIQQITFRKQQTDDIQMITQLPQFQY